MCEQCFDFRLDGWAPFSRQVQKVLQRWWGPRHWRGADRGPQWSPLVDSRERVHKVAALFALIDALGTSYRVH